MSRALPERGLGAALREALRCWPAWSAVVLVPALGGLLLCLPWSKFFYATLDGRVAPGTLRASLTEAFRFDQRELLASLQSSSAATLAALAAVALFAGVFCAGGWLELMLARREPRRESALCACFARGGVRHFARFVRLLACVLGMLALAAWLVYGPAWKQFVQRALFGIEPGAPGGEWEALRSEHTALAVTWVQDALFALAWLGISWWAIHVRAALAANSSRAVLRCGLGVAWTLARHPWKRGARSLAVVLAAAAAVAVLGACAARLDASFGADSGAFELTRLASLGLLALWVRALARGALYALALQETELDE